MHLEDALNILSIRWSYNAPMPSERELRTRYYEAMRFAHPDLNHSPGANDLSVTVNEAYQIARATFLPPRGNPRPFHPPPRQRRVGADLAGSPQHRNGAVPGSGNGTPRGDIVERGGRNGTAGHDHVTRFGTGRGDEGAINLGEDGAVVVTRGDDGFAVPAPNADAIAMVLEECHKIGDVTYVDRGAGMIQVMIQFVGFPLCTLLLNAQGRAATGETEFFLSIDSIDSTPAPPIAAVTALLVDQLNHHTVGAQSST